MQRPTFSQATKRDFENIKEAWAEFKRDISNPVDALLLIVAVLTVAALWILPWIL